MADKSRYFGIGIDTKELEKSIERGKQAFAKLGDEALKQGKVIDNIFSGQDISSNLDAEFKRLSRLSIDAFGSISADAQRVMKEIQEDTLSLSNVEKMMQGLNKAYEEGSISMQEYISASARLTVLHEQITGAIQQNEQVLRRETQQMEIAGDSIVSMQAKVALLTTEYMKLSEAQRNSAQGEGLLKQMSELQTKLDAAQSSMQRFGGVASSQFNMIGMSMQQIVRELPSLAMSPQMFFLAISNNLPVFTDALAQARKEYQLLTAAGKTATPVWKQVISSLLSWQTALSALPAVLIVLGPQIANFFQSFLTGRDKILSATDALKNINEELGSNNANYGENVVTLKSLAEEWGNLTDEASKTKWIKENQSEFDKLEISINDVWDAEKAFVDNTDDIIEAFKLRAQAAAAQELASEKYKEAMIKQREAELEAAKAPSATDKLTNMFVQSSLRSNPNTANLQTADQITSETYRDQRVEDLKDEAKAANTAADAYFDLYKARREEATGKLSGIGIEYDGGSNTKDKKSLSELKDYLNEVEQLRQDNEDRQVDLMEEGTEKQLAEINLRYDRELKAVKELRSNLEKAQGGKLTEEQTSIFDAAVTGIESGRKRDTNSLLSKQLEEEKDAMNRYLAEYGSYLEKRQAITEQYQEKIDSATNDWDKKYLQSQMAETLAKLDDEVQKKTSVITRLFGDMSKKSVEEMRSIADEAEHFLSFVESGEYQQDNAFGITKEQFDILSKSPEKLESVKNEIENVRNEADKTEAELRGLNDILRLIFKTTDKKELEKLFEQLNEKVGKVLQTVQFLSSVFSNLGEAFGSNALSGVAEGLNTAISAVNSAMQGAQVGAMFGGIGAAAGAAVGAVSSLASAIARIHDNKNEKRIQALQDQIDTLSSSYDRLGKAVEDAYSKDASNLIEQQNKLLEQQKVLIQQQIREEEDKKKTDDERIKEWKQQIEDINQAIQDNKEAATDAIFGEDVKSAIEDFVTAYADAWSESGDKAESAKETVKDMMRQMVTESIKAAVQSSGAMERIRKKLQEFYTDNVFSGWEQDYIYSMAEQLQKELDKQFGWADSLFKNEETASNAKQSASSGGFATMSQDSADELNGRFTAFQMSAEEIKSQISIGNVNLEAIKTNVADFKDIMTNCFNELSEINANTGAIVKPIQTMQADIAEMKNDIKNKM